LHVADAVTRFEFDGLVCDLDGVVYKGEVPIAGVPEALGELKRRGVQIVYCTNNSRSTVTEYREKLHGFGIDVGLDDIVTSATVSASVLATRGFDGSSAFVVGGNGIRSALAEIGVRIVDGTGESKVDLVVVGLDETFDYDKMRRAGLALHSGARLIATNDDSSLPTPTGLWPGAGAILASIEAVSGARAEVMGKPHAPMMDAVADRLRECTRIAIVGDRPDTDLAGGIARGWTTILVTSGVTSPQDAPNVVPRPNLILPDLAALRE
jgi:4-nitrophenyl phosphatase